jgi:AcrR family transcriptional regulator
MTRPTERADARRNRARLLSAAREVFAERGISAEIREICERSGIGVATLYRNFATKEELIAAISAEALGEIEGIVAEASNEPDAGLAIDRLLNGSFDVVERYHELAKAMSLVDAHDHEHEPPGGLGEAIDAIMLRGQAQGVVRADLAPGQLLEVPGSAAITYLRLLNNWPADVARRTARRMAWAGLSPEAQSVPGAPSETRE